MAMNLFVTAFFLKNYILQCNFQLSVERVFPGLWRKRKLSE